MRASGLAARARARMSATASRTASSLAEIEPHPAHLGLVHDVRRQDLHHDSRSPGQQGGRDDGGFLGIAGEERGRDRNGIGRQQTRELERVQPGASVLYRPCDDRLRDRNVRLEILRQARRRRHQRFERFPVANQVHKAAHGIGFGRVVRNAVSLEGRGHRIAAPDPHGEYRLRIGSACRDVLAPSRRPILPPTRPRRARSARSSPGWHRSQGPQAAPPNAEV